MVYNLCGVGAYEVIDHLVKDCIKRRFFWGCGGEKIASSITYMRNRSFFLHP